MAEQESNDGLLDKITPPADNTEAVSVEEQIQQAQEAGDWDKSFTLKNQRLNEQRAEAAAETRRLTPQPPAPVAESEEERANALVQQIGEAQAEGDWGKSFTLKGRLANLQEGRA